MKELETCLVLQCKLVINKIFSDRDRALVKNDLKSVKATVLGRVEPTEWDLSFYQLYHFQKIPRRKRPK